MKKISPIRIEDEYLIRSAEAEAEIMNRTPVQQLEYWAGLGQKISDYISPKTLLNVDAGISKICVEPVDDVVVSFAEVQADMDRCSSNGELSAAIADGNVKYQASVTHPGYLERVDPCGKKTLGMFKNGGFFALPFGADEVK